MTFLVKPNSLIPYMSVTHLYWTRIQLTFPVSSQLTVSLARTACGRETGMDSDPLPGVIEKITGEILMYCIA